MLLRILIFFMGLQSLCFSQESELDSLITGFMENYDIPGMGVGIVQNNRVIYEKGFGDKINSNTLFHMASVSKTVVAAAILHLREQGKLHLYDPVVKHLPYFQLEDGQYKKITILQMLSHCSGMPDVKDYEWDQPRYDDQCLESYVRGLKKTKLLFEPGERFSYSNMAYEVLGDLVAKVSGQSFESFVKTRVLLPAGMKNSCFSKPQNTPEHWALPHVGAPHARPCKVYPYNRIHGPSSTLHSNVKEMCGWLQVNLKKRLSNPAIKTNMGPKADKAGLGWFMGKLSNQKMISHSGSDLGFSSLLVLLPESSTGVVLMCNLTPVRLGRLLGGILAVLEKKPYKLGKPLAVIKVFKTLDTMGEEAALKQWRRLRETKDHDLTLKPVIGAIMFLLDLNDKEALLETVRMGLKLDPRFKPLPYIQYYLKRNPDHQVAKELLDVL